MKHAAIAVQQLKFMCVTRQIIVVFLQARTRVLHTDRGKIPKPWEDSNNRGKIPTAKLESKQPRDMNRPNQEILVPDWLITSQHDLKTSSDWLFT
eukprot:sb/3479296/